MEERNCKTKYPLVLIHGTGFRDLKMPVYWGRIPRVLREHGASVYFGEQDSWGSVESNAHAICARIDAILEQTGAEKVNLIAHSKGGVEARMVASSLGYGDRVASVTTISSPHRGSKTFTVFLKAPRAFFSIAAFAVTRSHGAVIATRSTTGSASSGTGIPIFGASARNSRCRTWNGSTRRIPTFRAYSIRASRA